MKSWLLVVLIAGCKCGSEETAETTAPPTKEVRVDKAIARVEGIEPKLAKLRHLSLDKTVPAAYQSADDFKKFVHAEIARDLPPDKSKKLSEAIFHLGFLDKPVDLATASEATVASQAAAYYDPTAKKFFMVMVPDNDMMLDTISAHELTHGLQDQHFDLKTFLSPKTPIDDDAQTARTFITEGDATFTMLAYMVAENTGLTDVSAIVPGMKIQLDMFANMSSKDYATSLKMQAAAMPNMDKEIQKAIDQMDQLPPAILRPMMDSYMKGSAVILAAFEKGGWPAVDDLYKNPPDSTEQVLHPTTKLVGKREPPIKVTVPKLDGELVSSNVIGELQWDVYFTLWTPDKATKASQGWGGDRYSVVKRTDGSLLGYIATAWDTVEDAKEFAAAYEASFGKRFPVTEGTSGRKHKVVVDGSKVFILDGSDDAALLAQLIKDTSMN